MCYFNDESHFPYRILSIKLFCVHCKTIFERERVKKKRNSVKETTNRDKWWSFWLCRCVIVMCVVTARFIQCANSYRFDIELASIDQFCERVRGPFFIYGSVLCSAHFKKVCRCKWETAYLCGCHYWRAIAHFFTFLCVQDSLRCFQMLLILYTSFP